MMWGRAVNDSVKKFLQVSLAPCGTSLMYFLAADLAR